MHLFLVIFPIQTRYWYQNSTSTYCIAINLLQKGSVPFRGLRGSQVPSPSCHQLPILISKWKRQREVKQRAMHLPPLVAALRYRALSPRKTTSPLHFCPSFLTQIPAALLCFGSLQRRTRCFERRERTGTQTQAARSWDAVKPDRSTKVEHVLQQCWYFSNFRVFFLLCTFKKSVLQWCHPSWATRDCWVFWAKWGMMNCSPEKFSKLVLLLRAALRLETYTRTSMALFTSSLWQQVPGTFHQHGYLPAMRGVLFATSDYWIISGRLRSGRHDTVIATSQCLL